jgi:PAS domain S-box-containing protein
LGAIVIQDYTKKNAYDINSIEVLEMIAHELSLYIERKKAEDVVNRLSKGIEQSPVCIVVTDINGNIEYINPKFTEVTGFTLKEAIGKNPHILKHGEYNEELSKNIWDTIKAGKDWKGDFYNKKKNGEYYWEAAIISPIFDDDNNITNYIAISEDITEKKNMINDLVKAKESAEEMNRLKSSFLANMSHELRTPLNGILGFADILKNDLQDQESRDMAQIIFKSGKRLHNTLNQILDLTTLHAEIAKVMKDNINVNNVVIESFNLYKAEALKKNLELKYEASTDNIFLFTDKNILLSTLNNLVDNAIKYTHEGNVAIKLFEEGENVVIEVVDTGIGIEKSNQELIFDEFRQVSEGYGRSFEGTGLGLSICKKYMKLIDGSLKLRSELYKGSTFRIELPKVVGQIRLELNSSSKKSGENNIPEYTFVPRKYNEKILYVENDKDCQSLLLKVFNDYVHIDIANDAMEGINKAKENDYAIILMDINLGSGLNGKDVTRLLRKIQKYKDIPIIAITAFAMEGDKQEFIDCGCTHYLSKPFEVNKMQDLIFGLLDKK